MSTSGFHMHLQSKHAYNTHTQRQIPPHSKIRWETKSCSLNHFQVYKQNKLNYNAITSMCRTYPKTLHSLTSPHFYHLWPPNTTFLMLCIYEFCFFPILCIHEITQYLCMTCLLRLAQCLPGSSRSGRAKDFNQDSPSTILFE